jgi:hypothetical protein
MTATINPNLLTELFEPMLLSNNFAVLEIKPPKNGNLISDWAKHYLKTKLESSEALWHTFSFDHYSHSSKECAIKKFEHSYLKEFIIFSNNKYNALKCTSWSPLQLTFNEIQENISRSPNLLDIYISHMNFNWTFVIPHERDFGPYYAKSSLR